MTNVNSAAMDILLNVRAHGGGIDEAIALLSVCADGGKDSDMADFLEEDGLSEQFRIWRECRDATIGVDKK